MRQRADSIELFDADTDIIPHDIHEQALVAQQESGLPISGRGTLVACDVLFAEVQRTVLTFWTRDADGHEAVHTYVGTFLVHWRPPGKEDTS